MWQQYLPHCRFKAYEETWWKVFFGSRVPTKHFIVIFLYYAKQFHTLSTGKLLSPRASSAAYRSLVSVWQSIIWTHRNLLGSSSHKNDCFFSCWAHDSFTTFSLFRLKFRDKTDGALRLPPGRISAWNIRTLSSFWHERNILHRHLSFFHPFHTIKLIFLYIAEQRLSIIPHAPPVS
jgi:hypothetical protein